MNTISINKKEYESLIFGKTSKIGFFEDKNTFNDSGFGIFKKVKTSSVSLINKLRKSWR